MIAHEWLSARLSSGRVTVAAAGAPAARNASGAPSVLRDHKQLAWWILNITIVLIAANRDLTAPVVSSRAGPSAPSSRAVGPACSSTSSLNDPGRICRPWMRVFGVAPGGGPKSALTR